MLRKNIKLFFVLFFNKNYIMEEIDVLFITNTEPIILNEKLNDKAFDCEMLLTFMDKQYGCLMPSADYYKYLKKRITEFKKNIYCNLTAEDKQIINLLDKFTIKLINDSIKINIEEMEFITRFNELND